MRWWRTNLRMALALIFVSGSLQVLGLRRTMRWLDRAVPLGKPGVTPDRRVARAVTLARRIASVAQRIPGKPRCLSRALVLRMVLRRIGVDGQLRIGVRRAKNFEAHAWIEVDGVAAGEAEDLEANFVAFPSPVEV